MPAICHPTQHPFNSPRRKLHEICHRRFGDPSIRLWVLILAATSRAQQHPPIAEQIAKAYGLDSFGQIEAIRYTFNAKGGSTLLKRGPGNPRLTGSL